MIDEADRLKTASLEQVRDIFDQGGIGVVLMGMPGVEKRLSRYPQLYSRVGFVHEFRPLSTDAVRGLFHHQWVPSGVALPHEGLNDEDVLATIIRITGGNFRLLHRLLTQIARLVEINALSRVTREVVEAARESLVIGTA
jgi:DNA transposition AAA+ family ATPase